MIYCFISLRFFWEVEPICLCTYTCEYICSNGLGNWLISYRGQELGPRKPVMHPQMASCVVGPKVLSLRQQRRSICCGRKGLRGSILFLLCWFFWVPNWLDGATPIEIRPFPFIFSAICQSFPETSSRHSSGIFCIHWASLNLVKPISRTIEFFGGKSIKNVDLKWIWCIYIRTHRLLWNT